MAHNDHFEAVYVFAIGCNDVGDYPNHYAWRLARMDVGQWGKNSVTLVSQLIICSHPIPQNKNNSKKRALIAVSSVPNAATVLRALTLSKHIKQTKENETIS
jgi:hypothetical protein